MREMFKKLLTIITITFLLFGQDVLVYAIEAPTPPPQPTSAVEQPEVPSAPVAPSLPPEPTLNSSETPISQPEANQPEETALPATEQTGLTPTSTPTEITPTTPPVSDNTPENTVTNQEAPTNGISKVSGEQSKDGEVGDPKIETGDALNTAAITTTANTNESSAASDPGTSGASVSNTDNGSSSDNSASLETNSSITTVQDNTANAANNLNMDATTGENSTSKNVGSSTIETGDANTSGTVITGLNTNLSNVAVSEFNVVDDQNGDLILDLAANCISGCGIFGDTEASNTDNGSDSTSSATLAQAADSETFQSNDATLENNINLSSNSGDNNADKNTGGDSTIQTGDANTSANILNFLNNNIAGNVVLGIVNIFGDLIGDIILPEFTTQSNTTASNTGNGTGSTNTSIIDQEISNQNFQNNDAVIENNLNLEAVTGNNETNKNTGGNSTVQTGDANIESQTLNIANSNINGGNWWLVLVNEAGEWVGKIIGAADGVNYAGSEGTQFSVNSNGDVTATNQKNGSDSNNTSAINQITNNTTVQNNVAKILNNINLFANTGGNSASKNTGGNSTIQTGDANIVANLVNFVNNNIVGNGKLTVVTVNVFGKWLGDFVGPGQKKENKTVQNQNNNPTTENNSQQSAEQNNNSKNNSSQDSDNTTTTNNSTNTNTTFVEPLKEVLSAISTSASSFSPDETIGEAAGESIEDNQLATNEPPVALTKGDTNEAQAINVNLAWLLILMPLAALVIFVIRMITLRNKL